MVAWGNVLALQRIEPQRNKGSAKVHFTTSLFSHTGSCMYLLRDCIIFMVVWFMIYKLVDIFYYNLFYCNYLPDIHVTSTFLSSCYHKSFLCHECLKFKAPGLYVYRHLEMHLPFYLIKLCYWFTKFILLFFEVALTIADYLLKWKFPKKYCHNAPKGVKVWGMYQQFELNNNKPPHTFL